MSAPICDECGIRDEETEWCGNCGCCKQHCQDYEGCNPECLDAGMYPDDCDGEVEYRMPLSGTGRSFPRCEKHWDARLIRQQEINERYPHNAPSDFDPSYAGEVWGEDDY